MREIFRATGILFVLIASAASAQAPVEMHHNVNISTNREGRLGYYGAPNAACGKNGPTEIQILERPSYGKITMRPDRLLAFVANIPSRASNCRGEFVNVTAVYYKPAQDFHGSDRAVLRIRFPGAENGAAETRTDEIYITVR